MKSIVKYLAFIGLLYTFSFSSWSAESLLSNNDSFENDASKNYWTATTLDGKALDVMRLNISDNLDSNNVSFDQIDSWLSANSPWRWATKAEMEAFVTFFESDSASFLTFNGNQWSPKGGEWNGLIRGEGQTGAGHENDGVSVAWGFTVKADFFGSVSHKHNFNASALGAAPLIVRNAQQDCSTSYGDFIDGVVVLQVASLSVECPDGTSNAPFSSVAAAQVAVRHIISHDKNIAGITVEIQSGQYVLSKGLTFNSADSGSESAPIIYKAAENAEVTLFGGVILEKDSFSRLSDSNVISSLVDGNVAANILQFDLSAAGVTELGSLVPHGFALEPSNRIAPAMLYSNNKKMTLSRWPNTGEVSQYLDNRPAEAGHTGMVSYADVIDVGPTIEGIDRFSDINFNTNGGTFSVAFDRMSHWQNITEIFLDGVLGKSWEWTYNQLKAVDLENNEVTLKRGEIGGISANKGSYFFFENIVEEIDDPGEFYIDRNNGKLYFYPTNEFNNGVTVLSTLNEAMVTINSAQYLNFDGINFDAGRHLGFDIKNSQYVNITNCAIRNFSLGAVSISGENNLISHCTISNVGGYGVELDGGIEATMSKSAGSEVKDTLITPIEIAQADNVVSYNTIYNFAWDQKSQVPGVSLRGVGNSAIFNEIYDAPHFAVLLRNSTENTVAYNYIHDLPVFHKDDGGAIYVGIGNFPHMRGNKINNNYLENIPTNGVYIDNFSSGVEVKNNIFNKVGYTNGTFSGININGGGQNIMMQNYFFDVERPIKYNKFAVNNVFDSYKDKILGVHQAFNTFGVEATPYKKFQDFIEFLAFSVEDDFKLQSSSALENLSMNKNVVLDARAEGTGVIEPSDNRWVLENNTVLSQVATEHQNQFDSLDGIFTITRGDDSWIGTLAFITEELPKIITSIIENTAYDQRVDSDGDGVVDEEDAFPYDPTESVDTDGDSIGNNADPDDDNDGYLDENDAYPLDPTRWLAEDNYQKPIAIINAPQAVNEGELITLDASSSTVAEGFEISYQWSLISGIDMIVAGDEVQLDIIAPEVSSSGDVIIELTLSDGQNSVSQTVQFTIVNVPAVVSASAQINNLNSNNKLTINSTVILDASNSTDSKGSDLTYSWIQDSGPSASLVGENSPQANFIVPNADVDTKISFTLTVTNPEGGSDSAQVNATIESVSDDPLPSTDKENSGGGSIGYILMLLISCFSRRVLKA